MSPDVRQIVLSRFWFAIAAVFVFAASTTLAPAQDASQQTTPKPSATARPARLAMPAQRQKTFSSCEQAANALYDAARHHDENALIAIVGPGARDIVTWTDDQSERYAQDDVFAKKYEQMHRLVAEPDNETTLYVGAENWPLPLPLIERNGVWFSIQISAGKKFSSVASAEMKWTRWTPSAASSPPKINSTPRPGNTRNI